MEMEQALIDNWNSVVKSSKTEVYVLGDFAFTGVKKMQEILSKLNGLKIIVRGNHDAAAHHLIRAGFDRVIENELINVGPHKMFVSHFPFYTKEEGVDQRYQHKRIYDEGKYWLLHGHVHQSWKQHGRQINVGCDVWNYKPISVQQIMELVEAGPQDIDMRPYVPREGAKQE